MSSRSRKTNLACLETSRPCSPPEDPKPGKIQTDLLSTQKVNKGHGGIERRTLTSSTMLNACAAWPGLAQVYRLEQEIQWWRPGQCCETSCEVEFGITSLSRQPAQGVSSAAPIGGLKQVPTIGEMSPQRRRHPFHHRWWRTCIGEYLRSDACLDPTGRLPKPCPSQAFHIHSSLPRLFLTLLQPWRGVRTRFPPATKTEKLQYFALSGLQSSCFTCIIPTTFS